MISRLHIENFRSIFNAEIEFSDTGLTIIVGANGSGKTNVVRALEFISDIHRGDLSSAVGAQGGQRSIIPKAIPYQKLSGTDTIVRYELKLTPPNKFYRSNFKLPGGIHELRFRTASRNNIRHIKEHLEFTQPLAVAEALDTDKQDDSRPISNWSRGRQSSIKFARTAANELEITTKPKISDFNALGYVEWLGFRFVEGMGVTLGTRDSLKAFLSEGRKRSNVDEDQITSSQTIQQLGSFFLSRSPQASAFRGTARNIKRFDFHITSLRGDQQPTTDTQLNSTGENLPAIVRWMTRDKKSNISWDRILSTLKDIFPYAYDVRNNLLRSGKEYIEFMETPKGRPVESWDASDGALRSLAILIAIESHPSDDTIIIEEPERGLHPWAIRYLFDHIRDAIDRRGIQVIITTHSPQVLEAAIPHEVVAVVRTNKEGTKLQKVSDIVASDSISSGELGRLWVKGLLGGYPHDVT